MNHYDALLAELRAIDKRMLRKLDHKRRPPESMPDEIWYGRDIPRDMLDKVLDYGGYPCIEGTPLVLCFYRRAYTEFCTFLFTTVAVYTTQLELEYTNHRSHYEKVECPLRYDEFRQIEYTQTYGFLSDTIAVTKQDGGADMIAIRHGHVYFSTAFMRCVDYVRQHGPVEANPPRFHKLEEDLLAVIEETYFSDKVTPLFEPRYTVSTKPLPEQPEAAKPQPSGSADWPKQALAKMDAFRRFAKENKPEQALQALREAAELGHGDACWIYGKLLHQEDYSKAVPLYMDAAFNGSALGAECAETFHIAMAEVLYRNNDLDGWAKQMNAAAAFGGYQPHLAAARLFLRDKNPTPAMRQQGLKFLKTAADLGSSEAMFHIGMELMKEDPKANWQVSRKWLEKAAMHGKIPAMLFLMLPVDVKTPEDWKRAYNWGRCAYTTLHGEEHKAAIAGAMKSIAISRKDHILWWAVKHTAPQQDEGGETP